MPRANKGPQLRWLERRQTFYVVWYERGAQRMKSLQTNDEMAAKRFLKEFRLNRAVAMNGGILAGDASFEDQHAKAIEQRGVGCIYFIGANIGVVKIGFTRCVRTRLQELQTGSPVPLSLLAIAPGGRDKEQEYHSRFAMFRMHGEWFAMTPQVRLEIELLNQQANAQMEVA